jgi:diguanylate cyclase (GGDEF)-like protein
MWTIIALGAGVGLFSVQQLDTVQIDLPFLVLAISTVTIASRMVVRLPRINGQITVSDTFIFLTTLVYGGEAGVLLAAAEGICSSIGVSKKAFTFAFNAAAMACSTFLSVWVVQLFFKPLTELAGTSVNFDANFVSAISVMAVVKYVSNTGAVAVAQALKTDKPLWLTWTENYLWTSITYFAGAFAAALIAKLGNAIGFYAIVAVAPVVAIVYWTYRTYAKNIEMTAAAAKAEQSERHVLELSRHISEQQRISRELEESREHFRRAAFHDALTGLPNRSLLTDQLRRAIRRTIEEENYNYGLLFLDMDRFKNINDSLGHVAGDRFLVMIARRLEKCVRPGDMVARLGGDEFAILLDHLSEFQDAVRVAERVQKELTRPFNLNGHEVYTTASIGITLSTIGYEHPENVLRDADTAMYRAKENGKARHEVFDTVMHARAVALLQLESDLRRAVERGELRVHYQPIVNIETEKIAGFEALARWQHPERGLVSPAEFIPVAEETGLIVEIGQWVLHESCRQMSEWQRLSPVFRPLTMSVNLSSKQFTQPDLIERIKQTLHETDFDPRCLKLEITESVVMQSAETASFMLKQLRALGVQVSIDDFGTGYSSLSYLHRFPVNTLKIDRFFIGKMGAGDENAEIVRTIITLASNLGMEVIAEGIETAEQLTQLRALKCEYGQGYFFSKPLKGEDAEALLLTWSAGDLAAYHETGESLAGDVKSLRLLS